MVVLLDAGKLGLSTARRAKFHGFSCRAAVNRRYRRIVAEIFWPRNTGIHSFQPEQYTIRASVSPFD
jgi:hypothetical protein